ncbi:MAG: hypothetical protein K0S98_2208, partial [Propionibacteriaceae bacterium]|nr:hypothetical protein [Propionibacteriaceae bacterium]
HGHPMRISEAAGTADVIGGLMLDDDNVSNYSAYTGTPSNNVGEQIGGTGGGAGHTHTISSDGAHTHTVTLPKRYVTAWFKRTA